MVTKEKNPGAASRPKQVQGKANPAARPKRAQGKVNTASRPAQSRQQAQTRRPGAEQKTATPKREQPPRKRAAAPEQKAPPQVNTPPVVYTPPIPFSRHRFLLRMLTVAAVVIALVFGLSIFFKVDGNLITVSGAEKYTAYQIREASGIQDGENLLTLSSARISARIRDALPFVKSVRVGIKLPDTVYIDIVEEELVYAVKSEQGSWWLINASGRILEQTDAATAEDHTRILGVSLAAPKSGEQAAALEEPAATPDPSDPSAAATPVTVTGAQRLGAAMAVIAQLEVNGILGRVASIQVENPGAMELWYGRQYQVKLGNTDGLDYKISAMKAAIEQMSDYQTGILDVSKAPQGEGVIFSNFQS